MPYVSATTHLPLGSVTITAKIDEFTFGAGLRSVAPLILEPEIHDLADRVARILDRDAKEEQQDFRAMEAITRANQDLREAIRNINYFYGIALASALTSGDPLDELSQLAITVGEFAERSLNRQEESGEQD